MILPGATLGILGGGQLGRMFAVAARTMGYRIMVLDPDPLSPAGLVADAHLRADYLAADALKRLAGECAAVTTEFENVPAESLNRLAQFCPVRPSGAAVSVTQDRIHEKTFLRANGFETARFAAVESMADLEAAITEIGTPALLKTSRFGYDGKGQLLIKSPDQAQAAFENLGKQPCVLEELVTLDKEISAVIARNAKGETAAYPVAENRHEHGILDTCTVPADISATTARTAVAVAEGIAEKLNYCGVLAVEFFVLQDGRLLVNEMAPRPHNSGHYTLDACACSQFEQQVRTLCDLPLGDTRLLSPAVMINLLGDLWQGQTPPPWHAVLRHAGAKLHLYGKLEARPGRKMGHCTVVAPTLEEAVATAAQIKRELKSG